MESVDEMEVPLRDFPEPRIFLRQALAITRANLRARYRRTAVGFLWVVMNPLILFGTQLLIYKQFFAINITNYPTYLMSGLLPWILIQQSLEMCTPILVFSGGLLRGLAVNPVVYLLAQILDNLTTFSAVFAFLLLPNIALGNISAISLLLLPLPIVILVVALLGMSWLLSMLNVYYRDTRFIVSFGLSAGYLVTPIFYSPELVTPALRPLFDINPLYRLIHPFQIALQEHRSLTEFAQSCSIALALATAALTGAWFFWKRNRNTLYAHI